MTVIGGSDQRSKLCKHLGFTAADFESSHVRFSDSVISRLLFAVSGRELGLYRFIPSPGATFHWIVSFVFIKTLA